MALHLGAIWSGIICVGTMVRYLVVHPIADRCHRPQTAETISKVWNIFLTFVFITFTRLFFRSGSNLDPAQANETAWRTARQMVNQIGNPWDTSVIPHVLGNYWNICFRSSIKLFENSSVRDTKAIESKDSVVFFY